MSEPVKYPVLLTEEEVCLLFRLLVCDPPHVRSPVAQSALAALVPVIEKGVLHRDALRGRAGSA